MKEVMHKVKGEKMGMDVMGGKNTRILPTVRLTDEDFPEIKDLKVGEKVTLCVECEVIAIRQGDEWNQTNLDTKMQATFKIKSVGLDEPNEADEAKEPKATTSGKDFEMEYAKKRSGGTGSRFDKKA